MSTVGVAVIGLGIMGSQHARALAAGHIEGGRLAAVCDVSPTRATQLAGELGVPGFDAAEDLLTSGPEAVVVATPHWSHVPIGIAALRRGCHVLLEKPVAPHVGLCRDMTAAHAATDRVYAVMFNQRTDPRYRHLRALIAGGELGPLRRLSWTVTDWYRTDAYYRSSDWRATWSGEGGGVLLNQSPHQLDLWQWLFGMPARVTAFCRFGRYRDIEVEDDVTAFLEYEDGCHGTFVTTTGEAPGTNRLEVVGERATVVLDSSATMRVIRNEVAMSEFAAQAEGGFEQPAHEVEDLTFDGAGGQHHEILANFCAAIARGAELVAPGPEGERSVELANAMLLSSWLGSPVELPIDATRYTAMLQERIDGLRPA